MLARRAYLVDGLATPYGNHEFQEPSCVITAFWEPWPQSTRDWPGAAPRKSTPRAKRLRRDIAVPEKVIGGAWDRLSNRECQGLSPLISFHTVAGRGYALCPESTYPSAVILVPGAGVHVIDLPIWLTRLVNPKFVLLFLRIFPVACLVAVIFATGFF